VIDRRQFGGTVAAFATVGTLNERVMNAAQPAAKIKEVSADLVIIGGGLGGCSAAIAALRNGLRVVLTEETDWIGGQLTSQAVPPDEHRWIETHGANASYRELRRRIRDYYRQHYPLTDAARQTTLLNPGNGSVSRLCHEPRVALAVLRDWFAPYVSNGKLTLMTECKAIGSELMGDLVQSVTVTSLRSSQLRVLTASFFIDASELGDLLPLTQTEFVTGSESRSETNELHAPDQAGPDNQQAFTICFPIEYVAGADHTIEQPAEYKFWRDFVPQLVPAWPGRLLDFTYTHPRSGMPRKLGFNPLGPKSGGVINLWRYRRIVDATNFKDGTYGGDISLVNWPQNDYVLGNLVGVSDQQWRDHMNQAKQLSLSLMYWLQTEVPRFDGGQGYPELRLRGDIVGTDDGLAKYPYVRESRRIRACFTVLEEHVGVEQRGSISGKSGDELKATTFGDSVGVGSYGIDLHPSTGGDNYIDFAALPFQVPLGALLPRRVQNLVAASKNIGVTHITGGCYRMHPVEWGIGEAAGCLIAYSLANRLKPQAIHQSARRLEAFQKMLQTQGVEISWS
jgi:hypothetical protein